MADLAALLTGLRRVLMLDYVPGANPVLLSQALAPLQQTLPGWQGKVGCGGLRTEPQSGSSNFQHA
jgi:hypothetical protein